MSSGTHVTSQAEGSEAHTAAPALCMKYGFSAYVASVDCYALGADFLWLALRGFCPPIGGSVAWAVQSGEPTQPKVVIAFDKSGLSQAKNAPHEGRFALLDEL